MTISIVFDIKYVWLMFPEMIGVPGAALTGWLPAVVLSFVVWVIREFTSIIRMRRIKNQESKI